MRAARAASADREQRLPPRAPQSGSEGSELENALDKRCKEALLKRLEVLQQCKEASTAYACVVDLQDALRYSKGETKALRKNYDELYEICESWHEQCLALKAEKEGREEDAAEAKGHEAAATEMQRQKRSVQQQLDTCQQQLAACELEMEGHKQACAASQQQITILKRQVQLSREELQKERELRESEAHAAQLAAAQAEVARASERQSAFALASGAKERLQQAEQEAAALRDQLQALQVAGVRKAAEERDEQAKRAAEAEARERQAAAAAAETAKLTAQLATLSGELEGAASRAEALQERWDESEKAVQEEKDARKAAQAKADAASQERDAAAKAAEALKAQLAEAAAAHQALQQEYLRAKSAAAAAPAPAAEPPPKPASSQAELDFKALRNELDGWKMVAEQSEAMTKKLERDLKTAQRQIAQFEAHREQIECAARARGQHEGQQAAEAMAGGRAGNKENAAQARKPRPSSGSSTRPSSATMMSARAKILAAGIEVMDRPSSRESGKRLGELLDEKVAAPSASG